MPGGTQALERSDLVDVHHDGRVVAVPRPSLLGAIVAKGAACALPGDSSRHLRDLALLCALVTDPFAMRESLTSKDRKRLGFASVLADRALPVWALVPAPIREQGADAYAVLTSPAGPSGEGGPEH